MVPVTPGRTSAVSCNAVAHSSGKRVRHPLRGLAPWHCITNGGIRILAAVLSWFSARLSGSFARKSLPSPKRLRVRLGRGRARVYLLLRRLFVASARLGANPALYCPVAASHQHVAGSNPRCRSGNSKECPPSGPDRPGIALWSERPHLMLHLGKSVFCGKCGAT